MAMLRQVLNLLRKGEMICPIRYPGEYQALAVELSDDVKTALAPFGRVLVHTEGLYYSSYADASSKSDVSDMREQFKRIRDTVAPVLEFLTLVTRVEGRSTTLSPGDIVRHADLLQKINNEPAYQTDLERLSGHKAYASYKTSPNNNDRLSKVFEVLADMGYLSLSNKDAQIYSVTGRIEHFYRVLEFIAEHEDISLESGAEDKTQQEMIL